MSAMYKADNPGPCSLEVTIPCLKCECSPPRLHLEGRSQWQCCKAAFSGQDQSLYSTEEFWLAMSSIKTQLRCGYLAIHCSSSLLLQQAAIASSIFEKQSYFKHKIQAEIYRSLAQNIKKSLPFWYCLQLLLYELSERGKEITNNPLSSRVMFR